jgi:Uma2 family endonuclease
LTRAEFHRRYEQMPDTKAELVNGVVYVSSPVSVAHSDPDGLLMTWLGTYAIATRGTQALPNTTCLLDERTEVQPDSVLRLRQEVGGRSHLTPESYLRGAPELVVEVARSSASYDLHDKREAYLRAGCLEYLVVLTETPEVRRLALVDGDHVQRASGADGVLRSGTFPGLWLDVPALLALDGSRVLATLMRGLADPSHAAFVRELASRLKV